MDSGLLLLLVFALVVLAVLVSCDMGLTDVLRSETELVLTALLAAFEEGCCESQSFAPPSQSLPPSGGDTDGEGKEGVGEEADGE